jgi:hypothetical protein
MFQVAPIVVGVLRDFFFSHRYEYIENVAASCMGYVSPSMFLYENPLKTHLIKIFVHVVLFIQI